MILALLVHFAISFAKISPKPPAPPVIKYTPSSFHGFEDRSSSDSKIATVSTYLFPFLKEIKESSAFPNSCCSFADTSSK